MITKANDEQRAQDIAVVVQLIEKENALKVEQGEGKNVDRELDEIERAYSSIGVSYGFSKELGENLLILMRGGEISILKPFRQD